MSDFTDDLVGVGSETSVRRRDNWDEILGLTVDTLAMSILAFVMAGVLAMILIPFASSNLSLAQVSGRGKSIKIVGFATTRGIFIFTRSVPELLWALVVVFVISPGILAGAVALAIHNVGVIGRLGADTVEDVSPAPIDALRSTGANTAQIYPHGVLPLIARQLLTFQ
jgi:phosphonate transport system permease protein